MPPLSVMTIMTNGLLSPYYASSTAVNILLGIKLQNPQIVPQNEDYYYPVTNAETNTVKLRNLPKVRQPVSG